MFSILTFILVFVPRRLTGPQPEMETSTFTLRIVVPCRLAFAWALGRGVTMPDLRKVA